MSEATIKDAPKAVEAIERRLDRLERATAQLYQIDRRFATPPAESIEGALDEILREQE